VDGSAHEGIDQDREALLRALKQGGVRFVLIGGAAIESHRQRYRTEDIDVTPDLERENLQRLADVLNDLKCRLEVDPGNPKAAVPLPDDYFTAASLSRMTVLNLRTAHGKLDVAVAPAGFPDGYKELARRALTGRVFATRVEVSIASLEDVEHSKRTAARPKDNRYLERVGRLEAPKLGQADVEVEPPSR
jgi:hypothetical protein